MKFREVRLSETENVKKEMWFFVQRMKTTSLGTIEEKEACVEAILDDVSVFIRKQLRRG